MAGSGARSGPDDLPHHAPTLARTIDRWRDPIITAILMGVSNARSEDLNRVIKLEGRRAYGFRNPTDQRRLRYATTRTQRRPPTVTNRRSHSITIPQPRPAQPRRIRFDGFGRGV